MQTVGRSTIARQRAPDATKPCADEIDASGTLYAQMTGCRSVDRTDVQSAGLPSRMYLIRQYAQTTLQLYAQLRAAGAAEADLALVRNGYDLAMHLCPASFRGSGKPLLAH